jgi:4-hydroxybenzoate polyprenyltransferase
VRSTAILFGTWIRPLLVTFGVAFASTLAYAGRLNDQGPAFYIIAVGGTIAHLVWQYATVDLDSPMSCKREFHRQAHGSCIADAFPVNFVRNGQLGWIVWTGLAVDYLLKTSTSLSHT